MKSRLFIAPIFCRNIWLVKVSNTPKIKTFINRKKTGRQKKIKKKKEKITKEQKNKIKKQKFWNNISKFTVYAFIFRKAKEQRWTSKK